MLNQLMAICAIAATATGAGGAVAKTKPAPNPPGGTIIVNVLPGLQRNEVTSSPDNRSEPFNMPQENPHTDSDAAYNEQKRVLDERFEHMFTLRRELENAQNAITSQWEEYNVLRQAYERQLKENQHTDSDAAYNEQKRLLDERFEHMFTLRRELESAQNAISSQWEEYNILRQAYERQLKRIIAAWVTNISYRA